MTTPTTCDRCPQPALPHMIHIGTGSHRLCHGCFIDFTAEFLTAHPDKSADLANRFGLPWPETGAEELARILLTAQEAQMAAMRQ